MIVAIIGILGQGFSWLNLMVHLVITALVVVVTAVAWKLELYGGFLFVIFGIIYLILMQDSQVVNFWIYLTIPVSLFLVGALFMLSKIVRQKEKELIIC